MLWKTNDKRNNAKKLINCLLEGTEIFGVTVNYNLKNTIASHELCLSSSEASLTDGSLNQVLREMKEHGKSSVEDFEEIFRQQAEIKEEKGGIIVREFQFFIPTNLVLENQGCKELNILGIKFRFNKTQTVLKKLDKSSRRELQRIHKSGNYGDVKIREPIKYFLTASIEAKSFHRARSELMNSFDTLRGLFELSMGMGRIHMAWDIKGKINYQKFQHPIFVFANRDLDNGFTSFHINVNDNATMNPFSLDAKAFGTLSKNVKLLQEKPPPKSSLFLLSNCLRLYAQAKDARDRDSSFISYWQIAEAISFPTEQGSTNSKVAKRLSSLGKHEGFIGSGYLYSLTKLAEKRNHIVHRGYKNIINDEELTILKMAVEIGLRWLIKARKELLNLNMIDEYFKMKDIGDSVLDAKGRVIELIQNENRRKNF